MYRMGKINLKNGGLNYFGPHFLFFARRGLNKNQYRVSFYAINLQIIIIVKKFKDLLA